ncbi:MAG: tRNA pseudouridine(55) synthase TruB [Verrucomicrobia bacterium]|nr:tRNA pseudouridine(55) synthase TruB [Verrucomicrobiota bacterium]
MNQDPEGILLVDKPSGITSHDVVDRVRRIFHMKKVGHAGTLDPMATGLMIILVGKATKVSQYLMSMDKEYTGTMRLGQSTDSQDAEGVVTEERPVPELTEAEVLAQMKTFVGDQYQTPPMFSAKKVGGQPLYKLARKGKTVEREPRVIHIHRFEMKHFALPEISFLVACSKGTYIRTIAHDLGEKFGCGAHLNVLRRTGIGDFKIENSSTLEVLAEATPTALRKYLIPVLQAVPSHAL